MKHRNLTSDGAVNRQLWRKKTSNWWTTGILIGEPEDQMAVARTVRELKTKDQLDVTCYFYFTSYALNMFRTLIYPSSEAYDYSVELPHWSCVLGSMCVGVSVWFGWVKPATRIPLQPNHTETPTHTEPRTHEKCGNSTE